MLVAMCTRKLTITLAIEAELRAKIPGPFVEFAELFSPGEAEPPPSIKGFGPWWIEVLLLTLPEDVCPSPRLADMCADFRAVLA